MARVGIRAAGFSTLMHPGAEVGELHGGERGGHEDADLEDRDAGERPLGRGLVLHAYSQPGTTSSSQVTGGATATIEKPQRISRRKT